MKIANAYFICIFYLHAITVSQVVDLVHNVSNVRYRLCADEIEPSTTPPSPQDKTSGV